MQESLSGAGYHISNPDALVEAHPRTGRATVTPPGVPSDPSCQLARTLSTDMRNDTPPEPLKLEDHLKHL